MAERFVAPATSISNTPAASSASPPAPGHDQRLQGRCSCRWAFVLEADEQVRREPGQLPEHEESQYVVAEDDAEHRPHEREERRIEAVRVRMTFEVAARVEHDERADAGYQRRE